MTTRRRDIVPGKERRAIPCPTPNRILSIKTTLSASASPSQPKRRPATRPSTTADVSKHLIKRPSSTHGPATKPLERKAATPSVTLSQTQKAITTQKTTARPTRPSTNPPLRPSSSSTMIVASQRPVQDKEKNVRALRVNDAGKYQSMHARPMSAVKKIGEDVKKQGTLKTASAMNTKKQGSQNTTTSAIMGQIRSASSVPAHKKVERTNAPEVKHPEQEMFLTEMDDLTDEYLQSYNDKGTDDFLVLAGDTDKDAKIMTADISMGLEQNVPIDIETEVTEDKPCIEEAKNEQQELEEHTVHEIPSSNIVESVAYNTDGANDEAATSGSEAHEFQETEGGEVEEKKQQPENEAPMKVTVEEDKLESKNVPAKQEITEKKKQEPENESPKQDIVVQEKQEAENAPPKQIVQEKKQEPENAAPRLQRKKGGSPISNDVIEETAIKLREQRKNKVQALAQAFETVIALQ